MEKESLYKEINESLRCIIEGVDNNVTNLANASAILLQHLENINWAGFYIFLNGRLELGPFQGKVACTRIEIGKGVCGTSFDRNETIVVKNVHEFPGHIACDCASNSEIVVPVHVNGQKWGVLDIDSPIIGRFDKEDQLGLEKFVKTLELQLSL